jgi:hypothetical protein
MRDENKVGGQTKSTIFISVVHHLPQGHNLSLKLRTYFESSKVPTVVFAFTGRQNTASANDADHLVPEHEAEANGCGQEARRAGSGPTA